MKTKNETTVKQFDAVQYMRQQRDKMSDELAEMSKAEIIAYFKRRKVESKVKPCA